MAIAAIIVFALGMAGLAHMNTAASGNDERQPADQNSFSGMMQNMDNHYQMMSKSFDALDHDFGQMMNMHDMSGLRKAMRHHHDMMADFQKNMTSQGKMWGRTMSMMDSGGMMGEGNGQSNFMGMTHNMDNHYGMMSSQFDSLDRNFNQMMKMHNMSDLKDAMKQHQQMMAEFHQSMMNQGNMWGQMMDMMDSNGMMNGQGSMMGNGGMMGSGMNGGMMGGGMMGGGRMGH